jgi:hypothetical protein
VQPGELSSNVELTALEVRMKVLSVRKLFRTPRGYIVVVNLALEIVV